MIRSSVYFLALALVGLLALMVTPSASAQSETALHRLITVSGEGIVNAIPDQATVRFGIATRHQNPEEARRQNAETAREAMNAVRALGVEERKLRLETLRLQPVREYNPETRRPEDKGFEAARELVVEIDDLDTLPALIAQIVQKGANRLNGVTYGLKDREGIRDKALVEAVMRAKQKAALMASTLGVELGEVVKISEQSIAMPFPVMRMESDAMMMAKAEAVPEPEAYAAGEMKVQATVQVTFMLK